MFKYLMGILFLLWTHLSIAVSDKSTTPSPEELNELNPWANPMPVVFPPKTRLLEIRQVMGLVEFIGKSGYAPLTRPTWLGNEVK